MDALAGTIACDREAAAEAEECTACGVAVTTAGSGISEQFKPAGRRLPEEGPRASIRNDGQAL